ncbi:n-acyl-phosphatidylethanolamine-hydrolyzing phospholipase D, mitochondrial [Caerostris extrusa]|uniref:N-acyl-phosphatidylethanolamine-hydrolyzing phospholipase D, mitochondrial n=1 Tax=Caerostris extrusa TaxID=172846 RepID=A0AAV4TRK2_CAEEX|nr:n-acyl-phosphatidylethanolamine-hydrolyzing phospholipase D, mitochondrial [Caerostris extrusa]
MSCSTEFCVINDYINELQKKFNDIAFKRIETINGMYITNSVNKSSSNDVRIFTETQVKRMLLKAFSSGMSSVTKKKLSYFSQGEDHDAIYKLDNVEDLKVGEEYSVQNVGHSTLLIQVPGFNILTDPVFNDVNSVLYPEKTFSHPSIEKLPKVDVILISHNHPDHIDKTSLQNILKEHQKNGWSLPTILVPMGDKKLVQSFGFKQVEEVEWFTNISTNKNDVNVNFISIPADHRSGRLGYDHHKSLVTGWIINPLKTNVLFKYSGDTRSLTDENQNAIDAVIWHEIEKKLLDDIPEIICFEPSGPNYTRCDMDVTHQSTSYSTLLKFVEAENLAKLSNKTPKDFIVKLKTIMMHHNKFEFGPDRFNEGLFIFKKLLLYLSLSDQDLKQELLKQQEKLERGLDRELLKQNSSYLSRPVIFTLPAQTSLLVHSKDFIIKDLLTTASKVKSFDEHQIKQYFMEYLTKNTIFPKIGERLNRQQINEMVFDPQTVFKYSKKGKNNI